MSNTPRMELDSYLRMIVTPLLTEPEALLLDVSTDELGVLITMRVHKHDMGIVIGKGGETAQALRHLVRIAGAKQNARISVKIEEPDGSSHFKKRSLEEALL